jgi:hypothetical protein
LYNKWQKAWHLYMTDDGDDLSRRGGQIRFIFQNSRLLLLLTFSIVCALHSAVSQIVVVRRGLSWSVVVCRGPSWSVVVCRGLALGAHACKEENNSNIANLLSFTCYHGLVSKVARAVTELL